MAARANWRGTPAVFVGIAMLALAAGVPSRAYAEIILDTFFNGPHSTFFIGAGTGYSAQITLISTPEPSGIVLAMVGAISLTLRRNFKFRSDE